MTGPRAQALEHALYPTPQGCPSGRRLSLPVGVPQGIYGLDTPTCIFLGAGPLSILIKGLLW